MQKVYGKFCRIQVSHNDDYYNDTFISVNFTWFADMDMH